jgi:hypothetical protein
MQIVGVISTILNHFTRATCFPPFLTVVSFDLKHDPDPVLKMGKFNTIYPKKSSFKFLIFLCNFLLFRLIFLYFVFYFVKCRECEIIFFNTKAIFVAEFHIAKFRIHLSFGATKIYRFRA